MSGIVRRWRPIQSTLKWRAGPDKPA